MPTLYKLHCVLHTLGSIILTLPYPQCIVGCQEWYQKWYSPPRHATADLPDKRIVIVLWFWTYCIIHTPQFTLQTFSRTFFFFFCFLSSGLAWPYWPCVLSHCLLTRRAYDEVKKVVFVHCAVYQRLWRSLAGCSFLHVSAAGKLVRAGCVMWAVCRSASVSDATVWTSGLHASGGL